MARVRLDLDQETYDHLLDSAVAEKRPIDWQAEVCLRRYFGLPFPPAPLPFPPAPAAALEPEKAKAA